MTPAPAHTRINTSFSRWKTNITHSSTNTQNQLEVHVVSAVHSPGCQSVWLEMSHWQVDLGWVSPHRVWWESALPVEGRSPPGTDRSEPSGTCTHASMCEYIQEACCCESWLVPGCEKLILLSVQTQLQGSVGTAGLPQALWGVLMAIVAIVTEESQTRESRMVPLWQIHQPTIGNPPWCTGRSFGSWSPWTLGHFCTPNASCASCRSPWRPERSRPCLSLLRLDQNVPTTLRNPCQYLRRSTRKGEERNFHSL